MEPGTLYLFYNEFFTEKNAVQDFIDSIYRDLKTYSEDELKTHLLSKAILIDELCKKIQDNLSLVRLRVAQANILNHTAKISDQKNLCDLALEKISLIDEKVRDQWDNGLKYGYYFVKGNINMFRYEFVSDEEHYNYTLNDLKYIMQAKYCYTQLFESYLNGDISIEGSNTKSLIVNYSKVLGILSRYVEPFYYLDLLKNHHPGHNGDINLSKVLMYDSIKDKTCDSYTPVLLLRIDREIRSIKKDKEFRSYRIDVLESMQEELKKDFKEYKKKYELGRNEIAKVSRELDEKTKKLEGYKKFIVANKLGLNQHGLYCHCDKGLLDDLTIKAGHSHTDVKWAKRFEVLIQSIKVDFDSARRKFYRSNAKSISFCEESVLVEQEDFIDDDMLLNENSVQLKESFNKCLSILDSIANVFNSAHQIISLENKGKVQFVNYFGRKDVKKHIETLNDNLFAGALYSISYEFHSENSYSMFKDLKKWRNAFEHDSLILTGSKSNISELIIKYPEVRAFVCEKEFRNKTMFLLQLTRSAIFSLVWDMRKLTKSKWKFVQQ